MRALRQITVTAIALLATLDVARSQDQMPWLPSLEAAQRTAAQTNRLILIHFWSTSCQPCMRLEKEVFSRPETARALEGNYVFVKMNVDEAPGTARHFGVSSIPADVIVTASGRFVTQMLSPPSANQYVAQLNQAAAGFRELNRQSQVAVATQAQLPTGAPPMATAAVMAPPVNQANPGVPPTGANPTANQGQYANDRYAEYFHQNQTQNPAAAQNYAVPPAAVQPQGYAPAAAAPPALPPQTAVVPQAPPAAQAYGAAATGYSNPQAPIRPAMPQPQLQLPPGCPPVGFDGHCPVTLVERQQWAMGDKTWGAVHRGRTYLFLGPEEQKKFLANPDLYSPVLSGNDPVMALDSQLAVPGRREYGITFDKRIYLFADEASMQRFHQNPNRYAADALQARR